MEVDLDMHSVFWRFKHLVACEMRKTKMGSRIYKSYHQILHNINVQRMRMRLQKFGPRIYREVSELLSVVGESYIVDFGTLLGVIRDNGPIKHDDDVDFSMYPDANAEKIVRMLVGEGYVFIKALAYEGVVTEFMLQKYGIAVDFFRQFRDDGGEYFYFYVNNQKTNYKWEGRILRRNLSRKIVTKCVCGTHVNIPSNFQQVLDITYPNWQIPDPDLASKSDCRPVQKLHGRVDEICDLDAAFRRCNLA